MKQKSIIQVIAACAFGSLIACAHTEPQVETSRQRCRGPANEAVKCESSVDATTTSLAAAASPEAEKPTRVILTTDQMRKAFERYDDRLEWRSWLDDPADILTFVAQSSYDSQLAKGESALAAYGVEHYVAYKDGLDFVNGVPIGQLKLTPEFILELHRRLTMNLSKWLKRIDRLGRGPEGLIPDGYLPDTAAYKKISNFGVGPLKKPLNEEEYQALMGNQWIEGFLELPSPLSRPGKRRGLIRYATKDTYMRKLNDLNDWYEKNKSVIDPVDLAARYAWRFVSIHPMKDGNGRTMLVLMNRILRENGIPPFARTNEEADIYMPEDRWVEVVRGGISDYVSLLKEMKWKDIPSIYNVNFKDAPRLSIYPETSTTRAGEQQLEKVDAAFRKNLSYMSRKLFPDSKEAEINIGNQDFVFTTDGFFYNTKGIPHVFHDGKLYPVADATYLLYGENGRVSPRRFSKRMLSGPHRQVLKDHFKFMLAVDRREIDTAKIEVGDYAVIEEANKKGEIFLYDWQKDVFENAIRIRDEDGQNPLAVLTTMRGYSSILQKGFAKDYAFTGADVVAQYQMSDMRLDGYAMVARKAKNKQWLATIEDSRAKLHQAARSLVAVVENNFAQLPASEQAYYSQHPKWKLFQDYKAQTALNYATYAEARTHIPQGQYIIIRSDNSVPRYVGFRSRQSYIDMAQKMPGYELFREWIYTGAQDLREGKQSESKLANRLNSSAPAYKVLVPKIADVLKTNHYDVRAADPEFARLYVDHYLHAINSPLKQAVSFSTATDLYIRSKDAEDEPELTQEAASPQTKEHVPFSTEGLTTNVYFVKVNADEVGQNFASKYFRQYEVLGLKPISAMRIVRTLGPDYFKVPAGAPTDRRTNFLTNGYLINPSKN